MNTTNMGMTVTRDANGGVKISVDPAMIERVRREGIQSLTPVIFSVTPVASIWPLLGLAAPRKEEELLAGVHI